MPFQIVEKVKNNSDIIVTTTDQFYEYLIGGRTVEEQAERIRLAGLDIGLSDAVCSEIKNEVVNIYTDPSYITLSDFNESEQTVTRTTVFSSEEIYNNIMSIRNHLDQGTTSWTLISSGVV